MRQRTNHRSEVTIDGVGIACTRRDCSEKVKGRNWAGGGTSRSQQDEAHTSLTKNIPAFRKTKSQALCEIRSWGTGHRTPKNR